VSEPREQVERVSTLELFFDLVFVFTITQLTTVLSDDPTPRGLLRVVLMLGVIWWMYDAYAWLTNAVAPDRTARRLLLLGGMAGFLVLAMSVPQAFSGGGVAFGLACLVVVCVHAGLFTRTSSEHTARHGRSVPRLAMRSGSGNLPSGRGGRSAGRAGRVRRPWRPPASSGHPAG